MKEQLIEILKDEPKSRTINQINEKLGLKTVDELNLMQNALKDLVRDGIVHESKSHEYMMMKNTKALKVGIIRINRSGNGYVDVEGEADVLVRQRELAGAINGDFVEIELNPIFNDEITAHIIKILRRDVKNLVGELVKVDNKLTFLPDDEKYNNLIVKITKDSLKGCVEGHKVLVSLDKEIGRRTFLGKVERIIGHKNDPGVDILSIAIKHGIYPEFSKLVLDELKNIPDEVNTVELNGRKDLTEEVIFTIDGDDTKDIDDAISIEKDGDNYILGVHIADVSNYVKMGTQLYEAAYVRGTSSYLADTVIPMIPHQLSNGICSLNPNVIRLTISCVMTINNKGKVIDYDIFPSFIKSRKQMTYKNVNKILMDNEIPEGYEEYADKLRLMNELAHILREEKINRGYIDFDIDEAKIIQDKDGKAIDVVKRTRGDGEMLIEDFMIAANETVATHISNMDLPFIYRVHDLPNSDKIEDFHNLLKQLGYKLHTNMMHISSKTIQNVLDELRDKNEFTVLSSLLLRSMKKAEYSTTNIGHFGLGSTNYTHFTSPIRRFPDLTVHRLLRTYLFEKRLDMETINFNQKYLIDVAKTSSEAEVAAIEAERDVLDMKMAEFMESKKGKEFDGTISGVQSFGMFVELDNLVEGLVHITNMDGYYNYVPELLSLIRKDKKKRYRIGDRVRIKVIGASKLSGTIDFEIAKEKVKNGNKE